MTINPHLKEGDQYQTLDQFVRPQFKPEEEVTQPGETQMVNPNLYNKLDALAAMLGGSKAPTGGAS